MTATAVVRLSDDEARTLASAHPAFAEQGGPVLAITTAGESDAEYIITLIKAVTQYTAETSESAQTVLSALLPSRSLTQSSAALRQIERNAQARSDLEDEFGLLTSGQVARAKRSTASNLSQLTYRWRMAGRIFAVGLGPETRFPGFQFDDHGDPRPIVAQVITAFDGALDSWDLALWFTTASGWLGGLRPVDVVIGPSSDGDHEELLRAVHEQVAELAELRQTSSPAE